MPKARRKISAVYNDFYKEIKQLEKLDQKNQAKFSNEKNRIFKYQLIILTEALFFAAFREYENFLREVFLLYCLEKSPRSGIVVKSYLKPKDFLHAESLIKSSMRFIDWANTSNLISRAEIYLQQGHPIKTPLSTNLDTLNDYRYIRNHIAHNSPESLEEYKKVLRKHLGTIPMNIPRPGEFLLLIDKKTPSKYKLLAFFDLMEKIADQLTA